MNSALVTTGIKPLTVGSTKTFMLQAFLNGQAWTLTGGSARLLMTDPNGASYDIAATVSGSTASAPWTVLNVPGSWVRTWKATDAAGVVDTLPPITFNVIVSPGTPL